MTTPTGGHTPGTVEKAARAAWEADRPTRRWADAGEATRDVYRRLAAAALSVVPAVTPDDGLRERVRRCVVMRRLRLWWHRVTCQKCRRSTR